MATDSADPEDGHQSGQALLRAALGADWDLLPALVQQVHTLSDVQTLTGRAAVQRGTNIIARLVAWIFRLPPATPDTVVIVTMTPTSRGESWSRQFGPRKFRTQLTPVGQGRIRERFGALWFEIALDANADGLHMPVSKGWCAGIPIPGPMLPVSETREYANDGRFCFDVRLSAPLIGLIVHYRGWLVVDATH